LSDYDAFLPNIRRVVMIIDVHGNDVSGGQRAGIKTKAEATSGAKKSLLKKTQIAAMSAAIPKIRRPRVRPGPMRA